ncbi:MAG: HAD family hydrolase [Actinomycetota bacterium]
MPLRTLYTDLDGTLLGPGGSLFATRNGPTLEAAKAIASLHSHDVELVLVSGRTRDQLHEIARLLGASAYIAELGGFIVERGLPDRIHREFGAFEGNGTPFERIVRSGAGAFLLERYPGLLELHTPWANQPREVTMLFRGLVDPTEVNTGLSDSGYGWLALQDNGLIRRNIPSLDTPQVHAYHLAPKGVGKAQAVRMHLELAGIPGEEAAAVGDSISDLDLASEVGEMFVVAGTGWKPDESTAANVRLLTREAGEGFAEAVGELLGSP